MTAALKPRPKLHRQASHFPALDDAGPKVTLPAWNYTQNRTQFGRLATGGCLYGGQTATFWTPLRDLLHISNGPIGCGVYTSANRPQPAGPSGIESFSNLNLCTDFQERDVVFGGTRKLSRAIDEAHVLFPNHNGMTILSTCPVELIGDDIDAVARAQSSVLGKPIVPVHCAGYRRSDGIGDTHSTIRQTWVNWANPGNQANPRDVTLICRESDCDWRSIAHLLAELGLNVVARWPAASNRDEIGRLGKSQLVISINAEYWAKLVHLQFGTPWVDVSFLGPTACAQSLREIATHFDASVQQRAALMISRQMPMALDSIANIIDRLAGKLYFSFSPIQPRAARYLKDFGIRVGSALQGWPGLDGRWHTADIPLRYSEMNVKQIYELLHRAQPDVLDGIGQDASMFRKRGFGIMDDYTQAELAGAACGFGGSERLGAALVRLFERPTARWMRPPWSR
jgi:nitrogenase molybdenum-iron protein alpha chain